MSRSGSARGRAGAILARLFPLPHGLFLHVTPLQRAARWLAARAARRAARLAPGAERCRAPLLALALARALLLLHAPGVLRRPLGIQPPCKLPVCLLLPPPPNSLHLVQLSPLSPIQSKAQSGPESSSDAQRGAHDWRAHEHLLQRSLPLVCILHGPHSPLGKRRGRSWRHAHAAYRRIPRSALAPGLLSAN